MAVVARDYARPITAAIREQPADQVAGHELVEATGRRDPPLDLVPRVFQVPVPDAQRRPCRVEQQRLACDHFENLDDSHGRLAGAARRDRRGHELPDQAGAV